MGGHDNYQPKQSKAKQKRFLEMGASHSLYALQLIKNIVYSQKAMTPSGWRVKVGIVCVWVAANYVSLFTAIIDFMSVIFRI